MRSGRIAMPNSRARIDWAVASKAKKGGQPSGDAHFLGKAGDLLAAVVIDGSGSGREAKAAADKCAVVLENWQGASISSVIRQMHDDLQGERGAAICMCFLDVGKSSMTWAAVGDVDGTIVRSHAMERLHCVVQQAGTLGVHLPKVRAQDVEITMPMSIVLTTDGVYQNYRKCLLGEWSAPEMTQRVMDGYGRPDDDSTVLALKIWEV